MWITLQASCEGFTGSVLIEGKLALNSLSKVLCVMNHDKREVFSLTCNNRSFIPLWVKDSSLKMVMFIIMLGVWVCDEENGNQVSVLPKISRLQGESH